MKVVKAMIPGTLCLLLLLLSGCVSSGMIDRLKGLDKKNAELERKLELQKPAMAELMTHIQAHHSRLWFAGQAGNWALADHQVQGLKAALDKAAKNYDKWEDVPKPLTMLIPLITGAEIEKLRAAIRVADKPQFTSSFEKLTKDCNTCHQATGREFIVIQTPTAPGYTNLQSAPKQSRTQ